MMINAHAQLGDISLCESLVSQIPKQLSSSLHIQNGLIDMWVSTSEKNSDHDFNFDILRVKRVLLIGQKMCSSKLYGQISSRFLP